MLVNVKTEKRQQTLECHPSSLLSAVQLNKEETLSVAQEKTCFNFSKGGLDYFRNLQPKMIEHNWSVCAREALC